MKKSKSKNKKNVRSGFLVFMAVLVLGTMGIVLHLIRGGGGGKSTVKCGGSTQGDCGSGYDCVTGASGYTCEPESCTTNKNLCKNGSTCNQNGKCVCPYGFTGEFCDQVLPEGDCNTDTCTLPRCRIERQYKEMKEFSPKLESAGACVMLKQQVADLAGRPCDDSQDCVDQAKQLCDANPKCKSFYYYGTKGKGRWCPKGEFVPPEKNKGKTESDNFIRYGDEIVLSIDKLSNQSRLLFSCGQCSDFDNSVTANKNELMTFVQKYGGENSPVRTDTITFKIVPTFSNKDNQNVGDDPGGKVLNTNDAFHLRAKYGDSKPSYYYLTEAKCTPKMYGKYKGNGSTFKRTGAKGYTSLGLASSSKTDQTVPTATLRFVDPGEDDNGKQDSTPVTLSKAYRLKFSKSSTSQYYVGLGDNPLSFGNNNNALLQGCAGKNGFLVTYGPGSKTNWFIMKPQSIVQAQYGNFYYVDKDKPKKCVCNDGYVNYPGDKQLCTQCRDKRGPSRRTDDKPATDCSMRLFGYKTDDFLNTKFALQCQASLDTTLKNTCRTNYGTNATYAGEDDNCKPDPCFATNWTYNCNVPAYWSDPSHDPKVWDSCDYVSKHKDKDAYPLWSSGPKKGQEAFVKYNGDLEVGHVPHDFAMRGN